MERRIFDLLSSYMDQENTQGWEIDDKLLRDTVLNLMIAGQDTTASALTWLFWLLSKNPSVEAKIREELQTTEPESDIEKLNKLVYLHAALCESLRLYPPVPFQLKTPIKTDILPSGHEVEPNTKIVLLTYSMGRMKRVWGKDCLEYKPERWISENGRIKYEPSYKFFAFNAGPRTCLGKQVAFTQLKTTAAAIIRNFDVQVIEGHSVAPSASIILRMKHGLMVRVTKRGYY
ncbi:cytochrome P450 86B1 [Tripterygium wilfordii]|uniref:Cytochrome P450 86B1 n=1 Tax=Tripterygium wilfordii TaxID=458696 RepID=A0A7J7DFD4_TRIWF|nr:alkane hydroxylase MAH1-like [Tripterygium wilfordii]KAF5745033.1 cytochrome P450 86B1 [Tripterygium wilfordii]